MIILTEQTTINNDYDMMIIINMMLTQQTTICVAQEDEAKQENPTWIVSMSQL